MKKIMKNSICSKKVIFRANVNHALPWSIPLTPEKQKCSFSGSSRFLNLTVSIYDLFKRLNIFNFKKIFSRIFPFEVLSTYILALGIYFWVKALT